MAKAYVTYDDRLAICREERERVARMFLSQTAPPPGVGLHGHAMQMASMTPYRAAEFVRKMEDPPRPMDEVIARTLTGGKGISAEALGYEYCGHGPSHPTGGDGMVWRDREGTLWLVQRVFDDDLNTAGVEYKRVRAVPTTKYEPIEE